MKGELLGAPHFADKPCVKLESTPLTSGMACCSTRPAATSPPIWPASVAKDFRFFGLRARPRRISRVQIQLEELRRGLPRGLSRRPFHPGLGQFVTIANLRWQFAHRYSVQTVGINNALAKPGTKPTRNGTTKCSIIAAAIRRITARSGSRLPQHHARVVCARADREHAHSARSAENDQHHRILLPGGNRALRARVRRGRTGGVPGNRRRGR